MSDYEAGQERGYVDGRASRDTEVAALKARVLELEAVVDAHQKYLDSMMDGENEYTSASFHLHTLLTSPSVVLADHDAAVWDEGYRAGGSQARRWMSDEPNLPDYPNPYRVADQNGGE